MSLFCIIGRDADGSAEKRDIYMDDHVKHLTMLNQQKKLFAAGPLMISAEENSPACGSLLIVDFENIEAVKQWFYKDPYYTSGVYKTTEVIPYIDAMSFLKG